MLEEAHYRHGDEVANEADALERSPMQTIFLPAFEQLFSLSTSQQNGAFPLAFCAVAWNNQECITRFNQPFPGAQCIAKLHFACQEMGIHGGRTADPRILSILSSGQMTNTRMQGMLYPLETPGIAERSESTKIVLRTFMQTIANMRQLAAAVQPVEGRDHGWWVAFDLPKEFVEYDNPAARALNITEEAGRTRDLIVVGLRVDHDAFPGCSRLFDALMA